MPGVLEHKVVIFDWDDTLLSSTHLAAMGHRLDTNHPFSDDLQRQLTALENAVNDLLKQAFCLVGPENIIIITNAEDGWMQLSAQKFIPNVIATIRQCRIMSARSAYELARPGDPVAWKACAMHFHVQQCFGIQLPFVIQDITQPTSSVTLAAAAADSVQPREKVGSDNLKNRRPMHGSSFSDTNLEHDKENIPSYPGDEDTPSTSSSPPTSVSTSPQKTTTIRHIVSFGDSVVEQRAACLVGQLIDKCVVKCVKLMERPSLSQLLKQLHTVTAKFKDVLDHPEPLLLSTMHARDIPRVQIAGPFPRASVSNENIAPSDFNR